MAIGLRDASSSVMATRRPYKPYVANLSALRCAPPKGMKPGQADYQSTAGCHPAPTSHRLKADRVRCDPYCLTTPPGPVPVLPPGAVPGPVGLIPGPFMPLVPEPFCCSGVPAVPVPGFGGGAPLGDVEDVLPLIDLGALIDHHDPFRLVLASHPGDAAADSRRSGHTAGHPTRARCSEKVADQIGRGRILLSSPRRTRRAESRPARHSAGLHSRGRPAFAPCTCCPGCPCCPEAVVVGGQEPM